MRRRRGLVERHADEALRGEVVDLVRLRPLDESDAGADIGQVVLDEVEIGVVMNAQFLDAPEVDRTGSAIRSVDLVVAIEQELSQVGSVLSRDAGNDG